MATIKISQETAAKIADDIDWERVDATTDEDIVRHVAEDPDVAPILSEAETVAAMAKTVRRRLGLSQPAFAERYGIPIGTLRDWEQGRKQPDATALTYLKVIAREPEMVDRALHPTEA